MTINSKNWPKQIFVENSRLGIMKTQKWHVEKVEVLCRKSSFYVFLFFLRWCRGSIVTFVLVPTSTFSLFIGYIWYLPEIQLGRSKTICGRMCRVQSKSTMFLIFFCFMKTILFFNFKFTVLRLFTFSAFD